MEFIPILLIAAAVFGICRAVDKAFSNKFRSKAQHMSGKAVRVSKTYGVFGVILSVIGILAIAVGISGSVLLLIGGVLVLAMGIGLGVYYLGHGIFYDSESFLVSHVGRKSATHFFRDIREQKLYLVQGGSVIIELFLSDGTSVSVQSSMDGVYPFLDTAFAGWCLQTGRDPQNCDFHDPEKHWWFPHEEDK